MPAAFEGLHVDLLLHHVNKRSYSKKADHILNANIP